MLLFSRCAYSYQNVPCEMVEARQTGAAAPAAPSAMSSGCEHVPASHAVGNGNVVAATAQITVNADMLACSPLNSAQLLLL